MHSEMGSEALTAFDFNQYFIKQYNTLGLRQAPGTV